MHHLLLLLISTCACLAQKPKSELLTLIKPRYKIDSLLKELIKERSHFFLKDSCFIMNVWKDDVGVTIYNYSKIKAYRSLSGAHKEKLHIGFFEIMGCDIFLTSSNEFDGLFENTKLLKRVKYIDFSKKIVPGNSNIPADVINKIPLGQLYEYKNGKFTATDY